jgi:hypothetical protein
MPKEIKEPAKDAETEENILELLNPAKFAEKVKEISQKAGEDLFVDKKVLITKISNGFITEFIHGIKIKRVFYNQLKELEPDVRLFLR